MSDPSSHIPGVDSSTSPRDLENGKEEDSEPASTTNHGMEASAGLDHMKHLLDQQQQLQTWSRQVNKKIFELETIYLDESAFGNIVRGWDLDGRLGPIRPRGQVDDKERLFSNSSYATWFDKKNHQDNTGNYSNKATTQHRGSYKKSNKKRKSDVTDDLYGGEDY